MNKPLPISAAIVTLNEEKNLPRCLESVRELVSEIIVIDSGSTDRTREIAEKSGAIFEIHAWQGFAAQKNIALQRCAQPWVLCLDADEALSPELADAIRKIFENGEPTQNGFLVNRRTFFLGGWINYAWRPDWLLRLVRRGHGEWRGLEPHGALRVAGKISRLDGDLSHYLNRNAAEQIAFSIHYARVMAESYQRAGKKCRWRHFIFSPWLAFFKLLILKQGWRDGWRGWAVCSIKWINVAAKYLFLLELERKKTEP